ncbi:NUMOD4 domain-containing protein [Paenibacillus elgii]|uniref:NUMOD4 domain-containing protein n=1 Tax=Paenibacillus elgii TaxID=189691 RepID=UPI00203EBDB9|nr:NUMOD4 domain-containing protein [Paenibacillus elgii]MCM3273976.1 NUMOD4 domain-containing protein [Paenibacillus elgii]
MDYLRNEIWKDIYGYEGLYKVSNYGNVKSFNKTKAGKKLNPKYDKDGYREVVLSNNKKKKIHTRSQACSLSLCS